MYQKSFHTITLRLWMKTFSHVQKLHATPGDISRNTTYYKPLLQNKMTHLNPVRLCWSQITPHYRHNPSPSLIGHHPLPIHPLLLSSIPAGQMVAALHIGHQRERERADRETPFAEFCGPNIPVSDPGPSLFHRPLIFFLCISLFRNRKCENSDGAVSWAKCLVFCFCSYEFKISTRRVIWCYSGDTCISSPVEQSLIKKKKRISSI